MSILASIDWSKGLPVEVGREWMLGLAEASPETAGYWDGVERDELRIKRCDSCGQFCHPRRIACPFCLGTGFQWKVACGRGKVYTYSDVHRVPRPEFLESAPYTVGIVELEEGVFLMTRFFPATRVEVGTPVRLAFRVLELGRKLPVFEAEERT